MEALDGTVTELWKLALKNNNFTDIKRFANDIELIAREYKIDMLHSYAAALLEKVDVFDIVGIQVLLKAFPEKVEALRELL